MTRISKCVRVFGFILALIAFGSASPASEKEADLTWVEPPLEATDWILKRFVSLLNPSHPGNRIGYRFFESDPIVFGEIPSSAEHLPGVKNADRIEEQYASKTGVFVKTLKVTGEHWVPQVWTFYLVPAMDGFELLWVVKTKEIGLNEFYSAQQCFRMSGGTNKKWRQRIAHTPAFSEYDLWASQEDRGAEKSSISFVRRGGHWQPIPPRTKRVFCPTPEGNAIDSARSAGDLSDTPDMKRYDPSHFEPPVDCGLVTRSNTDDTWVCGLFWERTSHVSNHHPADCLHAFVNLGPLPPNSKRAIRGRIYWMQSNKDDLYSRWKTDFGE